MAISQQSSYVVYASGYARVDQPGIHALTFDGVTGNLTSTGSFAGIANPSFVSAHPNRQWVYAVSETTEQQDGVPGGVWALRLSGDPATGGLEEINHRPSGGDAPCHTEIDAGGRWLVVCNYTSARVSVFPILDDGALGEMTDLVQHHGSGPFPGRQEGPHTHSSIFTPDNRFLIVADLGADHLVVYRFDFSAGKLLPHAQVQTRPGAGPRHMAFHPSGRWLYVTNELDNTLVAYSYDPSSAALSEVQRESALSSPSAPETTTADIHIAPSTQRVYVSNRGDDTVALFGMEEDGRLDRITVRPCGGQFPRNFTISPDERFLLVANQHSEDVLVLPVLDGAQDLGGSAARVPVQGASCVMFLPVPATRSGG